MKLWLLIGSRTTIGKSPVLRYRKESHLGPVRTRWLDFGHARPAVGIAGVGGCAAEDMLLLCYAAHRSLIQPPSAPFDRCASQNGHTSACFEG